MKAPTERLPPDIEQLLVEERQIPRQPPTSRQRILGRAHASLRDPIIAGGVAGGLASLWGTAAAKMVTTGAVLTLGIVAGTVLVTRSSWREAVVSDEVSARRSRTMAENEGAPRPVAHTSLPAPPPVSEPAGPLIDSRSGSIAAELALLERARTALAASHFDTALDVLAAHQRGYPRGRLLEEREGLRIQALVGQHRRADARKALNHFRGRFPRSVLLPDMEALFEGRQKRTRTDH